MRAKLHGGHIAGFVVLLRLANGVKRIAEQIEKHAARAGSHAGTKSRN